MFAQARRGPPVRAGRPKAEARKLSQIFLPTIADRVAKRISGARPPAWPGHGLTKRKHPFELSGKKKRRRDAPAFDWHFNHHLPPWIVMIVAKSGRVQQSKRTLSQRAVGPSLAALAEWRLNLWVLENFL